MINNVFNAKKACLAYLKIEPIINLRSIEYKLSKHYATYSL